VRVELSRSSVAGPWELLSTTSGDSLIWFVSGAASNSARVRVLLSANPTVGDTLATNFTIDLPSLTLTSPAGGESWEIGSAHSVTWTRDRLPGSVQLDWNANYPTGEWTMLANGQTGTSWTWTLPITEHNHARVRAIYESQPQFGDTSGDFSIIDPHLTMAAPNGNDTLILSVPYTIRWNRVGAAGPVRVELNRTYPTGTWEVLAVSVTADTFRWTASGVETGHARVRVSLVSNSAMNDVSDADFWILPRSLQLVAPLAGDSLGIGLPVTLRWTAVGVSPEAHLYVKRNWPSGTWEPLASNVNNPSWTWTVSGPASETARFRVLSAQMPSLGDTTDGAVRIGQPLLTFVSPSSAATYVPGDTATIAWTQRYCNGHVRVEISRQGMNGPWSELAVVAGNTLHWPVTAPGSAQVRFRISLVSLSSVFATTGFNCAIMIPTITVASPAAGFIQALGRDLSIEWTRSFMTSPVDVLVQRTGSGSVDTLRTLVAGDSIHWHANGATATAAHVIVRSRSAPITEDQSGNFSLVVPQLMLNAPHGGESLVVDSTTTVRWSRVGIADPVRIEMQRSATGSWEIVAANVSDTLFAWHISAPTTHEARLRITSTVDPTLGDTSDVFEILAPVLSFDSLPATHLIAGTGTDLSWTRTALTGPVELLLSRDGGLTWPDVIAGNLLSDFYHWIPAPPAAASARLLVRSVVNPQISAISELFEINVPALSIVAPAAGRELLVGDNIVVAWQRTAYDAPVRVLLRRTLGPTDTLGQGISADSLPATVHLPETDTSWIIVEDEATRAPRDSVAVLGPFAQDLAFEVFRHGEPWLLNRATALRWTRQRVADNVSVKINREFPAGVWEDLGTTAQDTLTVVLTGTPSDAAALAVISELRPSVADTIFNVHLVRPLLTLRPLGQTEYRIGTAMGITWSRQFAEDAVQLELDRHYPSGTWETLYSGTDTSFSWATSGDTTSYARLRIVSMMDLTLADTLQSDFVLFEPHLHFGETLYSDYYPDDTLHAQWTGNHTFPPYALMLLREMSVETLAVTNNLYHDWIVTPPRSDAAWLVVRDASGNADTSSTFSIHAPELTFTYPITSEADTAGSTLDVAWQWNDGSGSVRLEVSLNAMSGPWAILADSTTDAHFAFMVPQQNTDSLLFRVTSRRWATLQAISALRQIVVPALHVQTPGGDTWYIGEQKWIHWSRLHLIGDVRVEMTAQERSQPWQELGVAQTDSFLWTVTGPAADLVALRVSSVARPGVFDTTAAPLRIRRPQLTVLEPNGGDTLRVGDQVRLRWTGEGISGNVGLLLWRGDPVNRLDTLFENTPNDSSEIWTVTQPQAHECLLLIVSVDNHTVYDTSDARFEITGGDAAQDNHNSLPREYGFAVPFPNPFNAITQLEFALPHDGSVRLTIYDVLGREVETLVNEPRRAGVHRIAWHANRAASGVYFARLSSGNFVATHRLLLIK
jgi:hypothetical protein